MKYLLLILLLIPLHSFADQTFIDVPPERPDYIYIEDLVSKGIIDVGINFRPDDKITRAELAKIIVLATLGVANEDIINKKSFPDVGNQEWYWPYIESAKHFNLLHGYPSGYFKPGKNIMKPEALKVVLLSSGLIINKEASREYRDDVKNQWYAPYAYSAYDHGIYRGVLGRNGLPQMIFQANHEITRGEMCEYISKMVEKSTYYK